MKLVPDRKGGVFEEMKESPKVTDPIFGLDEHGACTPGFGVHSEQEIWAMEIETREPAVFPVFEERRETITCDHPGCSAFRTFIDGRHAPHPKIRGDADVPADWSSDEWHEQDGKDYCPKHGSGIGSIVPEEDPLPVCSEECGVDKAPVEEAAVPEPEDLPAPSALIAASTDLHGDGWSKVFWFVVGLGLGALVGLVAEVLK